MGVRRRSRFGQHVLLLHGDRRDDLGKPPAFDNNMLALVRPFGKGDARLEGDAGSHRVAISVDFDPREYTYWDAKFWTDRLFKSFGEGSQVGRTKGTVTR